MPHPEPVKKSDSEIDQMTNRLPQLKTSEKMALREALKNVRRSHPYGRIDYEKARLALKDMVRDGTISEQDMKRVLEAVFEE